MKRWAPVLALLAIASPAWAGSYRIVLNRPPGGKLLVGHAGVEAADDVTPTAKVRVLTPGNEVSQRGTVRVLVMNLGQRPFEFGPDQVTVKLGDGTVLQPTSVDAMEKGRMLVERENRYAGITDLRNRNGMQDLAQQTSGGPAAAGPAGSPASGSVDSSTLSQDNRSDESLLPGAGTLNDIYQLLVPLTVEPQKAWGGYYVFELPKAEFDRKADQPLTILVRTAGETHRFSAVLHWKK